MFLFKKKMKFSKQGPKTSGTYGVTTNFTPREEYELDAVRLASLVDDMPLGVVIQRVQPKQAGNHWAAYYRTPGFGKYYGKTLLECILKLSKDDRVIKKIQQNNHKNITKVLSKRSSGLL